MRGTTLIFLTAFTLTLCDEDLNANGCPVDFNIVKRIPHETYCNLFYSCVNGERIRQSCPGELVFNDVKGVCDWVDNVDCGDKGISEQEPPESSTVINSDGNSDPNAAPEICARDHSDGVLVANEYCNKFYMCTEGRPVEFECNPGLYYNYNVGRCDWPENVDCGDRIV